MSSRKQPPFPPNEEESSGKTSRRQTLPVPTVPAVGPIPAEKVPTRPADEVWGETARPPNRALQKSATNAGIGVPSPSLGGDTDFDAGGDRALSPLRQTSSFETNKDPSVRIKLSDPPKDPLDLGFGDDPASEALDLVSRQESSVAPAEPSRRGDPLAELRERYALGDFSGALTIAEGLLEDDPENGDAQRYAESCRDVLKQMYAARLGSLDQVPVVAIPAEQLRWLTLDHRSGFLLSHVDGVSTLEEILDVSGMNHLEAMRIIYELLQQKVIALQ
jgi:hypothetical protein